MEWGHENDGDPKAAPRQEVESASQRRRKALASCNTEHGDLLRCLRKGFYADCEEMRKAFWRCYVKHDGALENESNWRRYKTDSVKKTRTEPGNDDWADNFHTTPEGEQLHWSTK